MSLNLTLLGQAIAFAIFVGFCMKYVWPPIIAALQERQRRIDDGLAAGERGRAELDNAQEQSQKLLAESKAEASKLINNAEQRAAKIIEEAKQQAQVERERIIESAQEDIDQSVVRVKDELRGQLAALVVAGVTQLTSVEVRAGKHDDMLSELVERL